MKNIARLSVAACAALAFVQPATAQSTVTLYGAIGTDLISADKVFNASTRTSGSVSKLDDNAVVNSRWGVRATEDLGGGLSAVVNLEAGVNTDTGAARTPFFNRGAYVGLNGSFGSVKLGHQWNASDDINWKYFIFGYYSSFLMNGFFAISDYYDNAIKYTTPDLGGFKGIAYYSFGEQAGRGAAGRKLQFAASYDIGNFSIGASTFSEKSTTASVSTNKMNTIGMNYQFGFARPRLGFANTDVTYPAPFKATLIDVGVDVPVTAQFTTSLDYVKKNVKNSGDDTAFVRLIGSYALSKRTSLNANLIYSRNSGAADFAFITAGNGFTGAPGQSQRILTAGMTHSF